MYASSTSTATSNSNNNSNTNNNNNSNNTETKSSSDKKSIDEHDNNIIINTNRLKHSNNNNNNTINTTKYQSQYEEVIVNKNNIKEVFYLFIVLYTRVLEVLEEEEVKESVNPFPSAPMFLLFTSFLKQFCFGLIWNEREREREREREEEQREREQRTSRRIVVLEANTTVSVNTNTNDETHINHTHPQVLYSQLLNTCLRLLREIHRRHVGHRFSSLFASSLLLRVHTHTNNHKKKKPKKSKKVQWYSSFCVRFASKARRSPPHIRVHAHKNTPSVDDGKCGKEDREQRMTRDREADECLRLLMRTLDMTEVASSLDVLDSRLWLLDKERMQEWEKEWADVRMQQHTHTHMRAPRAIRVSELIPFVLSIKVQQEMKYTQEKQSENKMIERNIREFKEKLSSMSTANKYEVACLQKSLGDSYLKRIRSSRAEDLEECIKLYEKALCVFTIVSNPTEWAMATMHLAEAYFKRVYGSRGDNIDKCIKLYQESLLVLTRKSYSTEWANITFRIGRAYYKRIHGSRAANLERCIQYYEEYLLVRTRISYPGKWARATHHLALAYDVRIHGSRRDNAEKAIKLYEAALLVYTRESYPIQWANTISTLGVAYLCRISGSNAANMEKSIKLFKESLLVRTRKSCPYDWAHTTRNLAMVYRNRMHGSRADNIDKAIELMEQSLLVFTRKAYAFEWAQITANLGCTYLDRIHGSKAANTERGIKLLQDAMLVHTKTSYPEDWARSCVNLGGAYYDRIRGSKADNRDQAIGLMEQALLVFTKKSYPRLWAQTSTNLGISYSDRINGSRGDNIEKAIKLLEGSLLVYTEESDPSQWARVIEILGRIYNERVCGSRTENLMKSAKLFQTCNRVLTPNLFPIRWGRLQLRIVEGLLTRSESKQIPLRTLDANVLKNLQQALMIFLKHQDYSLCVRCCLYTGRYNLLSNQLEGAKRGFIASIHYIEKLRSRIHAGMQTKKRLAEQWISVYDHLVDVCVRLKQTEEAWKYAEAAKSRNLVDLLQSRFIVSQLKTKSLVDQYWRVLTSVLKEQHRLSAHTAKSASRFDAVDSSQLNVLQQQLSQFVLQHAPNSSSNAMRLKNIAVTSTDARRLLLDESDAIVEWYLGIDHVYTFVISRLAVRTFVVRGGRRKLWAAVDKYCKSYQSNRSDWMMNMEQMLYDIGCCLNVNCITKYLKKLHCLSVIFVPHWFLHAIPLHVIPLDPPNRSEYVVRYNEPIKSRLMDVFPKGIRYAPSCRVLLIKQRNLMCKRTTGKVKCVDIDEVKQSASEVSGHGLKFTNLVGINNPEAEHSNPTLNSIELDCIKKFWKAPKFVVSGNDAQIGLFVKKFNTAHQHSTTPESKRVDTAATKALRRMWNNCECLHFSCHGSFNLFRPMESGLDLAYQQRLSLADIFLLHLPNCKLVTLSACETGMIDIDNRSDEYLGLPSAFLFAGAAYTVASLWKVPTKSTTILMVKFYELLKNNKQISIPEALWQSQQWYRRLDDRMRAETASKLLGDSNAGRLPDMTRPFGSSRRRQRTSHANNPLINPRHPVHWAGFVCVG